MKIDPNPVTSKDIFRQHSMETMNAKYMIHGYFCPYLNKKLNTIILFLN